jgi:hypothetical protein
MTLHWHPFHVPRAESDRFRLFYRTFPIHPSDFKKLSQKGVEF